MRKVVCAAHHPGYRARESARMRTGGDPEYANDLGGSQAQRGARADSIERLIVWSVPAAASGRTWGAGQTGPIQGNKIGTASGRERVCQYVWISMDDGC